jgi:DNA-binding transcriptional LysR family regulator
MMSMDRLENLEVFVAVAEARGFAAAARRLGLSAPKVTRAVQLLEDHLGARLLHRTSRHVRLTDVGARYLADARRVLAQLDDADAAARGLHHEARGELSITAPQMFGRIHVAPLLVSFMEQNPQLTARTLFVDHVVDLHEEHVDVAVRIGRLQDSSLRAVRVGSVRRVLVASPAYLDAHGIPNTPNDLTAHSLVAFLGVQSHRHWAFRHGAEIRSVSPSPRLIVNSSDTAIAAALAGAGIARVLSYQVERELGEGRLRLVLTDYEPLPSPVQLVHAEVRQVPARVRRFVDFAAASLRPLLTRLNKAIADS